MSIVVSSSDAARFFLVRGLVLKIKIKVDVFASGLITC